MGKQNRVIVLKTVLFLTGTVLVWLVLAANAMAQGAGSADEREQFIKEIRRVENLNKKYTRDIEDIKEVLKQKEEEFDRKLNALEAKLGQQASAEQMDPPQVDAINPIDLEAATHEVLYEGGSLDPNDERFREELAKAHYNMGNMYFERGEHQRALVEYYEAINLNPYDADAHFNIAFVSQEHMGDYPTGMKHYRMYLYLRPDASDAEYVKKKILDGKMYMQTRIDSPIELDDTERSYLTR